MSRIVDPLAGPSTLAKNKRYVNPAYVAWVKTLPSVLSQREGCDAHHLHGHHQGGVGTKASDLYTFPLTREEHSYLHDYGWKRWENEHDTQWRYVAETMALAVKEGSLRG